ncbi:MAG: hypothetical protein JJE13_01995 [Thermoleophilia bacterium]|nr:hypothetical protein [Thermoleophilia bacterium]
MDTAFSRNLTVDVPPFKYTGIAHTFRNSPFNEYPYAMARLRWFTDSFDPVRHDLKFVSLKLTDVAEVNANFQYLQVSDAGRVDDILDVVHREVSNEERNAKDFGPHEPGIGKWVIDDDYNERHSLELPFGVDRKDLFNRVRERLRDQDTLEAAFDDVYLYPPEYSDVPGSDVRHSFRIFGHTKSGDRISAGARLDEAVGSVLAEISAETP